MSEHIRPTDGIHKTDPLTFLLEVEEKIMPVVDANAELEPNNPLYTLYKYAFGTLGLYFAIKKSIDNHRQGYTQLQKARPVGSRLEPRPLPQGDNGVGVGLDVDSQFEISLYNDGSLEIGSSPDATDAQFFETDTGYISSVTLNPQTGEMTPMLGKNELRRMLTLLQFTSGYYQSYIDKVPSVINARQQADIITNGTMRGTDFEFNTAPLPSSLVDPIIASLLPKFPSDAVRTLRKIPPL